MRYDEIVRFAEAARLGCWNPADYERYLQSFWWRSYRAHRLAIAGQQCEFDVVGVDPARYIPGGGLDTCTGLGSDFSMSTTSEGDAYSHWNNTGDPLM